MVSRSAEILMKLMNSHLNVPIVNVEINLPMHGIEIGISKSFIVKNTKKEKLKRLKANPLNAHMICVSRDLSVKIIETNIL
jgi:hypothetical protein